MRWDDLQINERLLNEYEKQKMKLLGLKCRLESVKEAFTVIYLPIQLVLWSQGFEIKGVEVSGFIMIVFTIIFIIILNRINKLIWRADVGLFELEKMNEINLEKTI